MQAGDKKPRSSPRFEKENIIPNTLCSMYKQVVLRLLSSRSFINIETKREKKLGKKKHIGGSF